MGIDQDYRYNPSSTAQAEPKVAAAQAEKLTRELRSLLEVIDQDASSIELALQQGLVSRNTLRQLGLSSGAGLKNIAIEAVAKRTELRARIADILPRCEKQAIIAMRNQALDEDSWFGSSERNIDSSKVRSRLARRITDFLPGLDANTLNLTFWLSAEDDANEEQQELADNEIDEILVKYGSNVPPAQANNPEATSEGASAKPTTESAATARSFGTKKSKDNGRTGVLVRAVIAQINSKLGEGRTAKDLLNRSTYSYPAGFDEAIEQYSIKSSANESLAFMALGSVIAEDLDINIGSMVDAELKKLIKTDKDFKDLKITPELKADLVEQVFVALKEANEDNDFTNKRAGDAAVSATGAKSKPFSLKLLLASEQYSSLKDRLNSGIASNQFLMAQKNELRWKLKLDDSCLDDFIEAVNLTPGINIDEDIAGLLASLKMHADPSARYKLIRNLFNLAS